MTIGLIRIDIYSNRNKCLHQCSAWIYPASSDLAFFEVDLGLGCGMPVFSHPGFMGGDQPVIQLYEAAADFTDSYP